MEDDGRKPEKEKIYDEKISPLMAGITKVCLEHNISMLCSFELQDYEDRSMVCTSALIGPDYKSSPAIAVAAEILMPEEDGGG